MSFVYNILVLVMLALTFGAQEFVPAIEFAQYARVLLPPVFFFSASLSVTFPVMLMMALFTGLVWDARNLPYKPEHLTAPATRELSVPSDFTEQIPGTAGDLVFGYSVILFGGLGTVMQGVRPLFRRGRWEVPVIMVGVATAAWLMLEYLLMSFLRGAFTFPSGMWIKVITEALLAMLVSPVMLYILHTLGRALHYEVRYEGLTYRFYGD